MKIQNVLQLANKQKYLSFPQMMFSEFKGIRFHMMIDPIKNKYQES